MTVRVTPEAEADLGEIFAWYSERGSELGLEFLGAFTGALRQLEQFPRSAPEIHPGIRRVLLHQFPYCVFYFLEPAGPWSWGASTRAGIRGCGVYESVPEHRGAGRGARRSPTVDMAP